MDFVATTMRDFLSVIPAVASSRSSHFTEGLEIDGIENNGAGRAALQ